MSTPNEASATNAGTSPADRAMRTGPGRAMGRPLRGNRRELVIGREARGYVALYRYVAALDTVFVLAIRSQGEAGYAR